MKKFLFLVFVFLFFPFFVLATSKVEINTASLEQLETLTGIGPVKAQAIIDARPFSSLDDLIRVKGIGEKTLQKIKDQGLAYVENQSLPPETPREALAEPLDLLPAETLPQDAIVPTVYSDGVIFNEILPSPEGPDQENEWIEIYNQNDFEIDLSGWIIQDTAGSTKAYILNTKIPALGYLFFLRTETKITLNNDGDELTLLNPNGEIIDSVAFDKAPLGQSYNRIDSSWTWGTTLTPNKANIITRKQISSAQSSKSALAPLNGTSTTEEKPETGSRDVSDINLGSLTSKNRASPFLIAFIVALFSSIAFLIIKSNLRAFWY